MKKHSLTNIIEYVKIDEFYVVCHFRCKIKNKTVISKVPFEPYEGKIEFTWQDILFHPIESYNRYYHTPIKIFDSFEDENTLVQKAFDKVSKYFKWDSQLKNYVYRL
ncbi:hypothetical protein [Sulfurimonas lithotrophica]|uniref:hypothetical protein n=1 Tax=Sulfurimonas lithotrophica TaxID=2590022 RepID=UPI001F51E65D|nr:hypothetical protein [Sulfurimonas lithotrophica]